MDDPGMHATSNGRRSRPSNISGEAQQAGAEAAITRLCFKR